MSFNTWNPDAFPLPGQAVFDHARQHIAAVSRGPGNLDLFVIGFDNRAWSTFWNDQTSPAKKSLEPPLEIAQTPSIYHPLGWQTDDMNG